MPYNPLQGTYERSECQLFALLSVVITQALTSNRITTELKTASWLPLSPSENFCQIVIAGIFYEIAKQKYLR